MLIVTFEGKAGIELRASTDRGDPDFRERRSVLDAHVFFFRHRSFPPTSTVPTIQRPPAQTCDNFECRLRGSVKNQSPSMLLIACQVYSK